VREPTAGGGGCGVAGDRVAGAGCGEVRDRGEMGIAVGVVLQRRDCVWTWIRAVRRIGDATPCSSWDSMDDKGDRQVTYRLGCLAVFPSVLHHHSQHTYPPIMSRTSSSDRATRVEGNPSAAFVFRFAGRLATSGCPSS